MTEWISPKGKQIGNSTVKVIMVFEVPSNSQSGIGGIGVVRSLWTEVNVESRKQCVEPESTRVVMIIFGAEDRKSTRLNSSHSSPSRMPSSA